jgi:signal-transduction protein with cAMP-binding, CBS, and nucleotidyltransferase domain
VSEVKVNHGQTLSKVPIFSGLTESEFAFLAQRAVPRHFSAGETVFTEGEPCTRIYVVESGHIRIFKSSSGGREQVLSIDGPGSSVAELPVFDGGNYPASVTAIEDATLLFVSKQDFQSLCLAHPLLNGTSVNRNCSRAETRTTPPDLPNSVLSSTPIVVLYAESDLTQTHEKSMRL